MRQPKESKPPDLEPGFSVIYSNRMEVLREVAVRWIRKHPLPPLEDEVIIVESNGMAQWLKLALADDKGLGISAAVSFQFPSRFLWQAYRAFLGPDIIPHESPYDKGPLKWRLMRLLNGLKDENRFPDFAQFLSDDPDGIKRYQLACRLADLYDQYQVYRADWLLDWTKGRDQIRNRNGKPKPIPSPHGWQAHLWRLIQRDVPEPERETSRSHLHGRFIDAARDFSLKDRLFCHRVIVFGISALPQQTLEALHALGRHMQILFFVLNPCRHYWADIPEANPLLAAWGKQGRDSIGLLCQYDDRGETFGCGFSEIDLFEEIEQEEKSGPLLQQVQQAILDLKSPPRASGKKGSVSALDHSITFQQAYSRQREVEILHDHLLFLFKERPELTPRDIIVMTPHIDMYTPHVESVFGNLSHGDPRFIPFTIADKPDGSGSTLIGAFEKLLHLPTSRISQSDLLDLLQVPAFRLRFGLEAEDILKLKRWIDGAGIRWGLNEAHRTTFDLPHGINENTWFFGLRRMFLGYAVGKGNPWHHIEPYDEIGGLEAELIGPLHSLYTCLEKHLHALNQPAAPKVWHHRMTAMINDFFLPSTSSDQLSRNLIQDMLNGWMRDCLNAGLEESLTLGVVRDALLSVIKDRNISQRFLVGMVNFCTLMPMRAIPFDIVCLLGLNDGEYPRGKAPEYFDLMARPGFRRPGDRSNREDDRYLFLEALISARKELYISYVARSATDNSQRMPSVLVSQLRDYLAEGWEIKRDASPLPDRLTCLHPLQPFSRAYFLPGEDRKIFTHSKEWRKMLDPVKEESPPERLSEAFIDIGPGFTQLADCLKNPVKCFFSQRLKVHFDQKGSATHNQEPFSLDGLSPFKQGRRLLKAGLSAPSPKWREAVHDAAQRLQWTGELPPGSFGPLSAHALTEPVIKMLERHHRLLADHPHPYAPLEIRFPFDIVGCDRNMLEDWLDGLRSDQSERPTPEDLHFMRWTFFPIDILDAKKNMARPESLLDLWVRHLAGCAKSIDLTSILIAPDGLITLPPLHPDKASAHLTEIVAFWWHSLHQPLPVTAKTAFAYLKTLSAHNGDDGHERAYEAARKAYEGDGYHYFGELGFGDGIYLKRCFPDFRALWRFQKGLFRTFSNKIYEPLLTDLQTDASP